MTTSKSERYKPDQTDLLSTRDVDVLTMVYEYGGVSADLLLKAFFPKPSARSYGYGRFHRLLDQDHLRAIRLPSIAGKGSGKSFFTLGRRGRRALAEVLQLPRSDLTRAEMPVSLFFVAHHLQTCSTRLIITQATSLPDAPTRLVEWRTERDLRAHPFSVRFGLQPPEPLIPDSYFVLALRTGQQAGFCLETDMGTVSKRRWAEKVRLYNKSPHAAVLITVPSEKRRAELLRLLEDVAEETNSDPTRFWIADHRELAPGNVLSDPLWWIPKVGASSLVPSVSPARHSADRSPVRPEGRSWPRSTGGGA
jgi:hypothetical protein